MKTMRNAMFSTTKDTKHTKGAHGVSCASCVSWFGKTLRAAGDALWLLWMLPGFVIAACAASAEEEHDERLKAIDGGAL